MANHAVKRVVQASDSSELDAASTTSDADTAPSAATHGAKAAYCVIFKPVFMLVLFVVLVVIATLGGDSVFSSRSTTDKVLSSSTAASEFEEPAGDTTSAKWLSPHRNWPLSPLTSHQAVRGTVSCVHSRVPPSKDISSKASHGRRASAEAHVEIAQHQTPTQGVALLFHGCKNSESTWVTGPEEQRFISAMHAAGWWVLAVASAAADAAHQHGGPKSGGCWDSHSLPNAQINADLKRTLQAVDDTLERFPLLESLPWVAIGVSSGGSFAAHVAGDISKRVSLVGLVPIVSSLPKRIMQVVSSGSIPRSDWPVPPFTLFVPMKNDPRSQAMVEKQAAALNRQNAVLSERAKQDPKAPPLTPFTEAPAAQVFVAPSFPISFKTLHAHLPALPLPASAHMMGCLLQIGEAFPRFRKSPGRNDPVTPAVLRAAMQGAESFLKGLVHRYHARLWLKPTAMHLLLPEGGQAAAMPPAAAAYYAAIAPLATELWNKDVHLELRDDGRSEGPMSCAVAAVDAALMLAGARQWGLPAETGRPVASWPEDGTSVSQAMAQEAATRRRAAAWIPKAPAQAMLGVHRGLHELFAPASAPAGTQNKDIDTADRLIMGNPVGVRLPGVPVTATFFNITAPSAGSKATELGGGLRGGDKYKSDTRKKLPFGPPSVRQFRETVLAGVGEVLNAAFARHDMTSANAREVVAWMQRIKSANVPVRRSDGENVGLLVHWGLLS